MCLKTVEVELWGMNLESRSVPNTSLNSLQIILDLPLFHCLHVKNNFCPFRDDVNQTKVYSKKVLIITLSYTILRSSDASDMKFQPRPNNLVFFNISTKAYFNLCEVITIIAR